MRLPSIFKQQSNKSYNYAPRYWDERKERIDNLKKQKEARKEGEYFNNARKKSFRDDWQAVQKMDRNRNSQFRFVIILILLICIAYAAIKYGNLDFLF